MSLKRLPSRCCGSIKIVGFSRDWQPLFPELISITVILFAMKNPNAAGDLMVGSGVIAIGTFQVPGEATISGSVQGELTAEILTVLPTGEAAGIIQSFLAKSISDHSARRTEPDRTPVRIRNCRALELML